MDIGLFRLSQMRLEEPEVLVETAGNPVQHVGRHHVFQFLGLVDCLADRIRELRHGIGQNTDNLKPFPGIGRKLPELRVFRRIRQSARDEPAHRGGTLGDVIRAFPDHVMQLIEILVETDEMRTGHVPVCMLASVHAWYASQDPRSPQAAG